MLMVNIFINMETITNFFKAVANWFRHIFKIKVVKINCISKNKHQVITFIGGTVNGKSFFLAKSWLISKINKFEKDGYTVIIKTKDNTKVEIVGNKYLRTVGDKNKGNDLADLPNCE